MKCAVPILLACFWSDPLFGLTLSNVYRGNGFTLSYPRFWIPVDTGLTVDTIVGFEDGRTVGLIILFEDDPDSLEELYNTAARDSGSDTVYDDPLRKSEFTTKQGVEGRKLIFIGTTGSGDRVRTIMFSFVRPRLAVLLLGGSSYTGAFYDYIWDEIAETIEFEHSLLSVLEGIELGGNWRWSEPFGTYNDRQYPWVFHTEHRWMMCNGNLPESIWIWMRGLGWVWTSETDYPYLYSEVTQSWLWYLRESRDPRWFFNFGSAAWESD